MDSVLCPRNHLANRHYLKPEVRVCVCERALPRSVPEQGVEYLQLAGVSPPRVPHTHHTAQHAARLALVQCLDILRHIHVCILAMHVCAMYIIHI